MKERFHNLIECTGFDAFEVIERWTIGNKWYEKRTTAYNHRGTIDEDFVTIEWAVTTFAYDAKGKLYCTIMRLHRETL